MTASLAAAVLALAASAPALAADPKASRLYEEALTRFEKKDMAGAVIQLKNALQIDKSMLPVHVLLGRALLAQGDVAAAEVAFNEALNLGVNRAEVVVPLARALVGQARLVELVAEGPKFDVNGLPPGVRMELLLVKAAAQSDLGAVREAYKAIQDARAANPQAVDTWLAEVPVQIRARRFQEAAAAADKAVALDARSAEAAYLQGSVQHARGNLPGALAAYDRALSLQPGHLEARLARAGLYMDQRKDEAVLTEVAEARKAAPRDPRAVYLRALVAERQGNGRDAQAMLAEITGLLDPVPINFMRYRPQLLMLGGLAHHGLGNSEKARPYLEALLRQQPAAPVAKLLSQIYLGAKEYDKAIEVLEAYLKLVPRDTQATVLLATSQMSKGRSSRAVQLLQDALKSEDSARLHTVLGLTLAGSGKPLDALAELEKAWRRDPSQIAAGAALVDLYLRNKQPAKSLEVAESLVKRSPKEPSYQALLGHARGASGDTARARAAYEQALKLDPGFTAADLGLARLDIRERKDDAAAQRLNRLLSRDDKNLDVLSDLALLAERRGQIDEAARLLTVAADHAGLANPGPALGLVDLQLRAGRVDAARDAHKALESKVPESLPVLMTGARVRLAAKDLPGAQAYLTRAGRIADFDARLLTQVALLQLTAQDAKGALYTAGKAVQADPNLLQARGLVVDASLRTGDIAQAEKLARELAQQQPRLALGQALLGDVAAARGQTAAALDAYRRAHQLEPSSASLQRLFLALSTQDPKAAADLAEGWLKSRQGDLAVKRMLAGSYARQARLPQARALYESVVAAAPDDADSLNNLANVMLMQQDAKALAVADKALALRPGVPHIVGTTGWAAHKAGQNDRALQLLRDARLRDPANADTRYFLGAVLVATGKPGEAREELRAALAGGSAFVHAKDARALLESLK